MTETPLRCEIYRSRREDELYLYLPEGDDPEALPEDLRKRLGRLEKAMTLELTPGRKLARADADKVIAALHDQGFYLQLPPPKEDYLLAVHRHNHKLTK